MKANLIFGWIMVIGGIIAAIYLVILIAIGDSPAMIYARGFIVIPFALWYGFRCLGKAREEKERLQHEAEK